LSSNAERSTTVGLFVVHFILKKWKLPLSGLAVVRYSDNCGRAKGDPDLHEDFAKKMIS
jgi:hypothetical protein